MSTGSAPVPPNQSTPPVEAAKPFKVSRWIVVLFLIMLGMYVCFEIAKYGFSAPLSPPTPAAQPAANAGPSLLSGFEEARQKKILEMARKNDALSEEMKKAGFADLATYKDVLAQLPACDATRRAILSGKTYALANQQTAQVVQFFCGIDDAWHPLPINASAIQPMTKRQAQAAGTNSRDLAQRTERQKEQDALDAALKSNSVTDFTQPAEKQVAQEMESQRSPAVAATPDAKHPGYPWNSYTGPLYHVFEQSVIEGLLANRLAGEFPGPVNVMVNQPFYSLDRMHVLIPVGARILGRSTRVEASGQRRLAVTFHRIVFQDGFSVDLNDFVAADQQGATGLNGRVDTHWPKILLSAALVGAIEGLSQYGGVGVGASSISNVRVGIGERTGSAAETIVNYGINKLPTITVFEGTRVKIWVAHDFELPDVENHTVKPNL